MCPVHPVHPAVARERDSVVPGGLRPTAPRKFALALRAARRLAHHVRLATSIADERLVRSPFAPRPHVLASASNRFGRLVDLSVSWYLEGRLPPGGDVELGLVDDAVALTGISPDVPPLIRAKVAQEAARLRAQEAPQIPE